MAGRERRGLRLHRAPQGSLTRSKKAGKTLLNLPDGALVLPPAPVPGDDALVAVTSEGGKLLVFPVKDVPELARGKGNKLFDIPSKKFASREDFLTGMAVVPKDKSLVVRSGDRKMTIELEATSKDYRGQRAQRGSVLPRGWRTRGRARDGVGGRRTSASPRRSRRRPSPRPNCGSAVARLSAS